MCYLYLWISSAHFIIIVCVHQHEVHPHAFGMSCKRSKPLLTSRFLLVSSYLETRRTRSPYFIICTVHIMAGVVANYYATKNVDRLEVYGVLLSLSLNVFQPPRVRIWNKRMCRELMKVIISKTLIVIYIYCTSSLLKLQSRRGRIIHFSPLLKHLLLL